MMIFRNFSKVSALLGVLACFLLVQAQKTTIPFWHSQGNTKDLLQEFADTFNASQDLYQVVPEESGTYDASAIRLVTALSAGNAPVLFDAELSIFIRLIDEGALVPLNSYLGTMDSAIIDDIYPILWQNGVLENERYGLPFNSSVPLLFYNSDLLAQRDVMPPSTWEDFESVSERMTTRQTKGYISTSLPLVIESLVQARGGNVLTPEGQPNFTSPEMVDMLEMLVRMAKKRHSTNRNMSEIDIALIDFIRTKGSMAMATSALWPAGQDYSIAFTPKAVVLPLNDGATQPITGAQMTIINGSSEEQIAGALAFWQFLMQPENIEKWAEVSYFLPVRRSVANQLTTVWARDDVRNMALQLLESNQLSLRPRVSDYINWQRYLSEAVDKAVAGRMSPSDALQEAQERALSEQ